MSDRVVLLFSALNANSIQEVAQRRLEDYIAGAGYVFEKIDGSNADNKPVRDILFGVSGQRGKYPQCFLRKPDESYTFIGLWDQVILIPASFCFDCLLGL